MFTLNCKGRLLVVDKPIVMGIINVTPDSFFGESRQQTVDAVLTEAEKMLKEGATILDIGGQSTRPESEKLTVDQELKRVLPAIEAIQRNFPKAFISVDTFYSSVVKEAVAAGASIVNDISAGSLDKKMIATVASLEIPYVLMHMQGTPQSMQEKPVYENVTKEILDFFIQKIPEITRAGIKDIMVDPGFGFGKSISHNFELLRNLPVLKMLNSPILLGISRKSFIYKTLNVAVEDSLSGTTALHSVGLLNGASILRVHDVKEAIECINLIDCYRFS